MLGMADIKDNRQLIEIQITHTENLNQNDPAPEPVSTPTGPLPGQRKGFLCPLSLLPQLSYVFIVVIQFFMQFKVKPKHAQESSMQSLVCICVNELPTCFKGFCTEVNLNFLFALFHRQGYPEDYQRANPSAYSDHYVEYSKPYDYGGISH